ncbi:MAG: ribosomal protein methyltransferase [Ferruginibacter sp.]|nr:ribosomal protein methyltransferase [Ferruginibacter sp.]
MQYYQFDFTGLQEGQADILVALLANAGFTGFEEQEQRLSACIAADDLDDVAFDQIIAANPVTFNKTVIDEINWNAKWEADFEAVTIPDPVTLMPFATIRAGFHQPEHRLIHDIIVTPKMSFGTGHHATTFLMVQQMSQLVFEDKTVIDFGTGTGVLAILAEKMGAARIIAIDNDEWSINNVKENIAANDCNRIAVVQADELQIPDKAAIILANINLNVITANINGIVAVCEDGADILFSGIMLADEPEILRVLADNFIEVLQVHRRDNWLAIEAKSNGTHELID